MHVQEKDREQEDSVLTLSLEKVDPEVAEAILQETKRQAREVLDWISRKK